MKKMVVFLIIIFSICYINSININVLPNSLKQNSSIYVHKGDKLTFQATGKWTLWDKYKPVDATGHQIIANDLGNWGLLLGSIGNGKPFPIGNKAEITSQDEGVLYLFPNKGDFKISNPSGSLDVSIFGGTPLQEFLNSLTAKAVKLTFNPKDKLLTTKLLVNEGTEIEIYAFGSWTMWDGVYPNVSADGHNLNVNGISWGKLYGSIGTSFGYQSEIFPIGEKVKFTSSKKGILSFFPYANDYLTIENGQMDIYIIGSKIATDEELNQIDADILKNLELQTLNKINEFRILSKIPSLVIEPLLSKDALNHSKYVVFNNIFSKDEEDGKKFFTGKTLEQRLLNLGFKRKSREIICQADNNNIAFNLIKNSVYHRIRILDPNIKYFGLGFYKNIDKQIFVFDFSYLNENEENPVWDYIVFPQNNSTNIDYSWNGIESPDPFPTGTMKPLGYPVTILFNKNINKVNKAEISDEKGNILDSFILTPDSDLNSKKFNGIVIIPKKIMEKNTKYIINISVTLANNSKENSYTWSFNTKNE